MHLKDYYTILELPSSASTEEVKKAYRRLAQVYHPDKNPRDPYAHAQFSVIKEAYETLTNPSGKEHYLQQRWYAQSMGKRPSATLLTPVAILKQVLELDRYVHSSDIHRMEQEGLYGYIGQLLSDEHIELLNRFDETGVNREIVEGILRSGHALPAGLATILAERLTKIGTLDALTRQDIERWVLQRRRNSLWERRKIWVILLVALVLCLVIFMAAGK